MSVPDHCLSFYFLCKTALQCYVVFCFVFFFSKRLARQGIKFLKNNNINNVYKVVSFLEII